MSIAHLCDHRLTLSRLPHPDSAEALHDEFNDLVEEWASVPVPAGLNARPDQNWSGSLTDYGPGEQQQALRRWFLVWGFDVQERDVLTVVTGPEAGQLLRVESVTKPTNPFTVHHLEVAVSRWHGNLTPGAGSDPESGEAPAEPTTPDPLPGPGPEPGPEPEPEPEPGPPDLPPPALLFFDDFSGGVLAPAQNGVSWAGTNTGSQDAVGILPDAGNASGYALGFTFGGNADLADDAWAEKRMRFPDLERCYIALRFAIPANYVHRNAIGADNNKVLRLWDEVYGPTPSHPTWGSVIHVGLSTLPHSSGASVVINEFLPSGGGTGNHGTGPWTTLFQPGQLCDIGYEVTRSSAPGVADGRIRLWVNDVLVLDYTGDICYDNFDTPGAANVIRNGYILGWSNSGFTETTTIKLQRVAVASERIEL